MFIAEKRITTSMRKHLEQVVNRKNSDEQENLRENLGRELGNVN